MGIDVGTSSIKAMLLDAATGDSVVEAQGYDVDIPQPDWAEQNPETWWEKLLVVLDTLKSRAPEKYNAVGGIGFCGQMHGITMLDKDGNVLRPSIVWLDQRTKAEVEIISQKMRGMGLESRSENPVSAGFALPSLLWLKNHEPENFAKISAILMPKDFIRYKMTGKIGADFSDASATGAFDVSQKTWLWDLIDAFDIPREIFPECHNATEIAGNVRSDVAKRLGLNEKIAVVYGSADQPSQSLGNGILSDGLTVANIGTGGQVAACTGKNRFDKKLRTHTFCHALKDTYTIYGATLCSGMSLKWASRIFGKTDYKVIDAEASKIAPGSEGLLYLPYLSGERTPILDPFAKGMFFGMKLGHGRSHFFRSVMEGVTFSLKDSLDILHEMGIFSDVIVASGGGSHSSLWLQIQADILESKIKVCTVKEQACLGACIMAGIGAGFWNSAEEACKQLVTFDEKIYEPCHENFEIYRKMFDVYKKLYYNTKELMRDLN